MTTHGPLTRKELTDLANSGEASLTALSTSGQPTSPAAQQVATELRKVVDRLKSAATAMSPANAGIGRLYRVAWNVGLAVFSFVYVAKYEHSPALCYLVAGLAVGGGATQLVHFFRRRIAARHVVLETAIQIPAVLVVFAGIFQGYGLKPPSGSDPTTALDALYFSVVTWTTLGYGDFTALPELRLLAAMEAFWGYVLFGFFVGLVVNEIASRPSA